MSSSSVIASRRIVLGALAVLCAAAGGLAYTGASASASSLPDGRVFEMVTPVEDQGADVYAPFVVSQFYVLIGVSGLFTQLPVQASVDGDAVAYAGDASVGGMGETGLKVGDEYVARRLPGGGWAQSAISPPGVKQAYYQGFTGDLSSGVLQAGEAVPGFEESRLFEVGAPGSIVESPEVPRGGYKFLYSHPTVKGGEGVYYPLFASNPSNRSAEEFRTPGVPKTYSGASGVLEFAGASAGFGELLFEANSVLSGGAPEGEAGANNLYVSVGGRPVLVNVAPGGVAEAGATFGAPTGNFPTADDPDFSHVVSADGSRVFWTDLNTGVLYGSEGVGTAGQRSVELDASEGPGLSGGGRYWTASEDGSRVYFTDENQLTADSTAGGGEPDLYEYDFERPVGARLTDLTVDAGGHADVVGVIGVSEEERAQEEQAGRFVYFVARGVLAGSGTNAQGVSAEAEQDNLYVLRAGSGVRFIARLTEKDGHEALGEAVSRLPRREFGDWQAGLGNRTAEVTPGGGGLVFMSDDQAVGGYAPRLEGSELEEVYVYEYATGSLACASCDPAHEPPQANTIASFEGKGGFLPPSWSSTYLPDWLSSSGGRVVFDSSEPLVPQDTNGEPDVYEWERDGEGTCQLPAGCVYLLSGGTSSSGSWLGGESESGNDVFIISRAHLVEAGQGEEFAMYDARVGGVEPTVPPACTGTGCQGVPAPPPTFATPPSSTYDGPANFPPPAPATPVKAKPKPLTNPQKLHAALMACRKLHDHARRHACETRADKQYPTRTNKTVKRRK